MSFFLLFYYLPALSCVSFCLVVFLFVVCWCFVVVVGNYVAGCVCVFLLRLCMYLCVFDLVVMVVVGVRPCCVRGV